MKNVMMKNGTGTWREITEMLCYSVLLHVKRMGVIKEKRPAFGRTLPGNGQTVYGAIRLMKQSALLLAVVFSAAVAAGAQEQADGSSPLCAQATIDGQLPVRGLAIRNPSSGAIDTFLKFIDTELAPARFNHLFIQVDYNYAFKTHPELHSGQPLSEDDVKRIVAVCKKHGIKIVPQINLLGHQSWASVTGSLLKVYPEFDETPHIQMPEKYEWPNADGLYCRSYCPLHPEVHKVVFDLIDEVMDAFETNLFHAGMDEVFYIGDPKCPRCGGRDRAELFAGEITRIQHHLAQRNGRLYIWGDRLLDGKTTGIGEWEASMNQTFRAIDMIPKDVFICDWHYDQAIPTPVYFALKGFDVAICPWHKVKVAENELNDMLRFRQQSPKPMSHHFQGIIQTIWSDADSFLKSYYSTDAATENKDSEAACIKRLMEEFKKL